MTSYPDTSSAIYHVVVNFNIPVVNCKPRIAPRDENLHMDSSVDFGPGPSGMQREYEMYATEM